MLWTSLIKYRIALIFFVFITWGCSSVKVVSFENPRTDFSKFEEYTLKKPLSDDKELSPEGQLFIEKFENAIKSEMSQRGYKLTYSPDLEVSYDIHSATQRDTNVSRSPNYFNPWFYDNTYRVTQTNYTESIILVELKDANTGKTAWQGSLDLRQSKNSKNKDSVIPEAVHTIFSSYPYLSGSDKKIELETKKKKR